MVDRLTAIAVAGLLMATVCGTAQKTAPTTPAPTPSTTQAPTPTATAVTTTTIPEPPTQVANNAATNASPLASGTFGAAVLSATPDVAAASGRFEAAITMIPGPDAEFDDDVTITLSGAFAGNGDSELTMDWRDIFSMAGGGEELPEEFADVFNEPIRLKVIDGTSYIKWSFFEMFLGTDK